MELLSLAGLDVRSLKFIAIQYVKVVVTLLKKDPIFVEGSHQGHHFFTLVGVNHTQHEAQILT